MKKVLVIILIIAALLATSACGKKVDPMALVDQRIANGEEDVMLFDYFRQVVGTEEQQGYYEIVLYAIPDKTIGMHSVENVRMDVHTDGGLRYQRMASYEIPYEAFTKAMEIADEYKMIKWEEGDDKYSYAIDGCSYVCKFPYGDKYYRVSSGAMPEDGMDAFNAVLEVLQSYIPAGN